MFVNSGAQLDTGQLQRQDSQGAKLHSQLQMVDSQAEHQHRRQRSRPRCAKVGTHLPVEPDLIANTAQNMMCSNSYRSLYDAYSG